MVTGELYAHITDYFLMTLTACNPLKLQAPACQNKNEPGETCTKNGQTQDARKFAKKTKKIILLEEIEIMIKMKKIKTFKS